MNIQPYVYFHGRADEAIAFYRQALGAELRMRMSFDDSPQEHPAGLLPADWGPKVMHAELMFGAHKMMVSDGMTREPGVYQGFGLTFGAADAAEAARAFAGLSDGGQVKMPLAPSFFSPAFGMLVDRFGIDWIVVAEVPMPG